MKNLKIDIDKEKMDFLIQMIDKKINSPLTSSMGRLFDAVSSLVGICSVARYEGEAAVELEKALYLVNSPQSIVHRGYKFDIKKDKEVFIVILDRIIKDIVRDVRDNVPVGIISLKFHNAICKMVKDACNLLRKRYKVNKVCLSGGVFQNKYLRENVGTFLKREGFKVYLHKNVPTHDGGIALGQAVLAMRVESRE